MSSSHDMDQAYSVPARSHTDASECFGRIISTWTLLMSLPLKKMDIMLCLIIASSVCCVYVVGRSLRHVQVKQFGLSTCSMRESVDLN